MRKGVGLRGPLAMTDASAKLLIEKGVITDAEFKAKLNTERANYLAVLNTLKGRAVNIDPANFSVG